MSRKTRRNEQTALLDRALPGIAIGLTLGAIVSVSDAQVSPYGPFGFYGTFGPDRFCGTIRTAVIRTDKATGKRKRVGFRTRHTCRVPSTVTSSLTVTFAAS